MAQVTQQQRILRIEELLRDLNKMPPEKHEVVRLPWPGSDHLLCQVIQISAEEVLLNPRSHRVRSQLQDNAEWQDVSADPYSSAAQKVVERLVRAARSEDDFAALRDSLLKEGQTDPGVITYDGVLVNANTRAVAISSIDDPGKRYLRVAVLPSTASPDEMSLLELRLQMQKELKVDYTLTNELLFIEELSNERHLPDSQIARELRIFPESPKKGEAEVNLRLRLLDLIRHLQHIPSGGLPISFFDDLSYEQLREVHRAHQSLLDRDPAEAERYLESFLLTVAVGITPVHKIRKIDTAFMTRYMLPQLEDDEQVGRFATELATSPVATPPEGPRGARALMGPTASATVPDGEPQVDAKRLIDLVTGRDNTVQVPNSNFSFDKKDVVEAIKAAVTTGIKDKDRDLRDENKLDAPIDAVRTANTAMARALDNLAVVASDPEFDAKRRKTLEAAFKRLVRTQRALETALTKSGILGK
jgi:hypothetical protein